MFLIKLWKSLFISSMDKFRHWKGLLMPQPSLVYLYRVRVRVSCLRSLQKVEPCSTFRKGICNLSRNVFGCCRVCNIGQTSFRVCYIGQHFVRLVSQWRCEASCRTNRTVQQRLTNLGPVSWKLRKLFGPEKLFLRPRPAYSIRLVFS